MKNIFLPMLIIIMISILHWKCAPSTELQVSTDEVPKIVLSKSRCRGFCPAFTIAFYEEKKVRYQGIANVKVIGERVFEIKRKEFDHLIEIFQKAEFQNFEDVYLTKYMDIPKQILIFNGKKIEFHEQVAPKEILELSHALEKFLPE